MPNRASVQVGSDPAVTTSFDSANRPTTDSAGSTYSHDADGRLTARPGQTLDWDSLGRLTGVLTSPGGATVATYTYDALDRLRVVDHGGSDRTRFRYVGLTTTVAQTVEDVSGSVVRSVGTSWSSELLMDWTGAGVSQRIYGTNGHHDLTWIAGPDGAVAGSLRYDPWGVVVSSSGAGLPDFRFQSSWHDTTTALSWVVTRWYAPALGRFVSEDTLLGQPEQPASRHLYAYAQGDPLTGIDPSGRVTIDVVRQETTKLRDTFRAFFYFTGSFKLVTVWNVFKTFVAWVDWHGELRVPRYYGSSTGTTFVLARYLLWWDTRIPDAAVTVRIVASVIAHYKSGYERTIESYDVTRLGGGIRCAICNDQVNPIWTPSAYGRITQVRMTVALRYGVPGWNEAGADFFLIRVRFVPAL